MSDKIDPREEGNGLCETLTLKSSYVFFKQVVFFELLPQDFPLEFATGGYIVPPEPETKTRVLETIQNILLHVCLYSLVLQTTPGQVVQGGSACSRRCLCPFPAPSPAVLLSDPGAVGVKALPIPEWLSLPMGDHSWFLSTGAYLYRSAK